MIRMMNKGLKIICLVFFGVLTGSMVLMILARNFSFINIDVLWVDEIGRYIFVYLIFWGSGLAMMSKEHMRVTFILEKFSPNIQKVFEVIFDLLTIVVCLVIIRTGITLVESSMNQELFSLRKYGINMSMAWWNAAVPVGGVLMLFYAVLNLIERLRGKSSETSHS